MADLDRAGLIELLDRLGSSDDATVLDAARALHRKVADAELGWDDLIRADVGIEPSAPEPAVETLRETDPDSAEVLRLIDRLMRRGVSESSREDLIEMKRQIGEGTLDPDDARYVRALARRLGV